MVIEETIIIKLNKLKWYHKKEIARIDEALRVVKRYDGNISQLQRQDISRQYRNQIKNNLFGKCSCGNELDGKYKTCKKCRKRGLEYYYRKKKKIGK